MGITSLFKLVTIFLTVMISVNIPTAHPVSAIPLDEMVIKSLIAECKKVSYENGTLKIYYNTQGFQGAVKLFFGTSLSSSGLLMLHLAFRYNNPVLRTPFTVGLALLLCVGGVKLLNKSFSDFKKTFTNSLCLILDRNGIGLEEDGPRLPWNQLRTKLQKTKSDKEQTIRLINTKKFSFIELKEGDIAIPVNDIAHIIKLYQESWYPNSNL